MRRHTHLQIAACAALFLVLRATLAGGGATAFAQTRSSSAYTLTIYVDEGDRASSEAVAMQQARAKSGSGAGPNLGHVFIDLANGDRHTYIGYYGDPDNLARGQIRPDGDLIAKDGWTVRSREYPISDETARQIHALIDRWATDGRQWSACHNCADFAEAAARIAGLPIEDLTREWGLFDIPERWGRFLRQHGGIPNNHRVQSVKSWTACAQGANDSDRRAIRGALDADEVTVITGSLAKATFANAARTPMTVTIGGTTNMTFTVPPGGSRSVDVNPGPNAVLIFSADHRALPTDAIFNFQCGKAYRFSFKIFE